jgi:hypothetical protein
MEAAGTSERRYACTGLHGATTNLHTRRRQYPSCSGGRSVAKQTNKINVQLMWDKQETATEFCCENFFKSVNLEDRDTHVNFSEEWRCSFINTQWRRTCKVSTDTEPGYKQLPDRIVAETVLSAQ